MRRIARPWRVVVSAGIAGLLVTSFSSTFGANAEPAKPKVGAAVPLSY
jgi:hypothetical protein